MTTEFPFVWHALSNTTVSEWNQMHVWCCAYLPRMKWVVASTSTCFMFADESDYVRFVMRFG